MLEEFNKWYKNSGSAWSFPYVSTNRDRFEVAWRAALEWVLSRIDYANSDGSIIVDIKKELNG